MANVKDETIEEIVDDTEVQAADQIRQSTETSIKALVNSIKSHTNRLKQSKEVLEKIDPQFEDAKRTIVAEFDVAMGTLLKRRNGLLKALEVAQEENSKALKAQIKSIQKSSNKLIACKDDCRTLLQQKETQKAIEAVVSVLNDVKSTENELASVEIHYKQGDQLLNEFLETYGTVTVAKTVRRPKGASTGANSQVNDDAKADE